MSADWGLRNSRIRLLRQFPHVGSPGFLATYSYEPLSRRTNLARGNGTATGFTFDLASRLTSMSHDLANTTHDAVFSYNWTIASQLARRQSTNGQLSGWPVAARNDTYAVNGLNQYTQVTGRSYVHDDNGNLINNGIRNYAYDVENRLVSVSGSPSMSLSYDPLGRLRQTVANGQTVQFLYDGDRLIAEYNGSSTTVLRRYVHGPGIDEPIVWYEGSGLTSSTRRWLHTDERGSVIAHSVANGNATTYSYGPYGEPGNDNWTGSRFRYTGQISLPEARLYHYKARVYDPIDGRFLQTDPIGYEDDVNLYAYTGNDPVNKKDPTGKSWDPATRLGDVVKRERDGAQAQIRQSQAAADARMSDRLGAGYQETDVGRGTSAAGAATAIGSDAASRRIPQASSSLGAIAKGAGPVYGAVGQFADGYRETKSADGADIDVIVVGAIGQLSTGAAVGLGAVAVSGPYAGVTGPAAGYAFDNAYGQDVNNSSREAYVAVTDRMFNLGAYVDRALNYLFLGLLGSADVP